MPGNGVQSPEAGTGLPPWSWAEERLVVSRECWLAIVRSDGCPHLMPVWAVWLDPSLWFGSSENRPRHGISVPVRIAAPRPITVPSLSLSKELLRRSATETRCGGLPTCRTRGNGTEYTADNVCFRLEPACVFGTAENDLTGSRTRWAFQTGTTGSTES
jgi:hypothetical protein